MINANDLINNLKSKYYKKGYKVDERPEILAVYETLDRSDLPKTNFIMQLQNLILLHEESKDFGAGGYNTKTNTITYSTDMDLYHELFHMASTMNDGKSTGITKYEEGLIEDEEDNFVKSCYGLDEGITDMFTEMANDNAPSGYPFEKLCAEMLRNLFGLKIFEGYFNNSYDEFIAGFPEEIQVDIIDLIYNLDEYQDLTRLVYSNESEPADITALEEITESIVTSLVTIATTVGKDKTEIQEFFNDKANDRKIQSIRELIKLDSAIENSVSREM